MINIYAYSSNGEEEVLPLDILAAEKFAEGC